MRSLRKPVAVVLLLTSLSAYASDYREEAVRSKTTEYTDKFTSIWAPLGFTIGGGAATLTGGLWTMMAAMLSAGVREYGGGSSGFYDAMTVCGGVVLVAGVTLLSVGIVKFVLRGHYLREHYGE